jgi:hypothetical protein
LGPSLLDLSLFQAALEDTYSRLKLFSDLDWSEISQEYIASHEHYPSDMSDFVFHFPEFLEHKIAQEDCPPYLGEMAYYELILSLLRASQYSSPSSKGIHLNSTLSFLNLEFDVSLMNKKVEGGEIQIIHRPHILCLYLDASHKLNELEISASQLETLQLFEKSPSLALEELTPKARESALELLHSGLLLMIA